MAVRDTTRPGEPRWADLESSDVDVAKAFYSQLFGWEIQEAGPEYGGYVTFLKDGAQVAGLNAPMGGGPASNAWLTYLQVDDAQAVAKAARAAGATVLVEPMVVGDQGTMAVLADPTGAVVGIWQSGAHAGFGAVDEAGTAVWHELNTHDYDAALAFYTEVFGWKPEVLSDTAEFRYSTFGPADLPVGGVFDASGVLPKEMPSHWQLYLGVEDVTEAVARAEELGGSVIRKPWDSQFGSFALVADPNGAVFVLGSVDPSTAELAATETKDPA